MTERERKLYSLNDQGNIYGTQYSIYKNREKSYQIPAHCTVFEIYVLFYVLQKS